MKLTKYDNIESISVHANSHGDAEIHYMVSPTGNSGHTFFTDVIPRNALAGRDIINELTEVYGFEIKY